MKKLKAGVIGATGYAGFELVRLLINHTYIELAAVSSVSYTGKKISEVYPQLTGICELVLTDEDKVTEDCDIVFASLPAGHSEPIARRCFDEGKIFIDIGADFRLKDEGDYEKWYGRSFEDKELHKEAVYSIPELHRNNLKGAKLIANPGCYVTSVCLGLYPALISGEAEPSGIVADSKSGATGAGRGLSLNTHFTECNEAFAPYKLACHRHTPEIEQVLGEAVKNKLRLTFIPHLLPANRGIESTIYVNLKDNYDFKKLRKAYEEAYADEPFVKLLPEGAIANIKNVKYSNYCHISLHEDSRTGKLIIVSVLDNMVKGAAGQAIQNMNISLGFDEVEGLGAVPPAF